jgi:hypothetical protein
MKLGFLLMPATKGHFPRTLLHFGLSPTWFPALPDSKAPGIVLIRREALRIIKNAAERGNGH